MEYEYIKTPKVDVDCTKEQFVHEFDKLCENTRKGGKQMIFYI